MRYLVLSAVIAALLSAGCARRHAQLVSDGMEQRFRCEESEVTSEPYEEGYVAACRGHRAYCTDVGHFECKELTPEVTAIQQASFASKCPPEQVRALQTLKHSPIESQVRIDACGANWSCVVTVDRATCQPEQGSVSSAVAPPPIDGPPPPPLAADPSCQPPCRAGFSCDHGRCVPQCKQACDAASVCVNGQCVSKCNPPCPGNERCTSEATCVPR